MKNLILSAAVLIMFSVSANANNGKPDNEKVLKTFTEIFKDAHNVSWNEAGKNYEAFFISDEVKTRAMFDSKGNLMQTIRYFKEDKMPANILYNIKKQYSGKEIWGITEVSNKNGIIYNIVLRDEKDYLTINANNNGETELVTKYKRGDL